MSAGGIASEGSGQEPPNRNRRPGSANRAGIFYIVLGLCVAVLTYFTVILVQPGGSSDAVGMWVVFIWLPGLLAGAVATILLVMLARRARSTPNFLLAGVGFFFYLALYLAGARAIGWL